MDFYFPEELWSKEEKASLIIDKNTVYVHIQTNFLNCFTLKSDSLIMHIIQTKKCFKENNIKSSYVPTIKNIKFQYLKQSF